MLRRVATKGLTPATVVPHRIAGRGSRTRGERTRRRTRKHFHEAYPMRPCRPAFLTIALAFVACTERAPVRADTLTRVAPAADSAQDTGAASRAMTSAVLVLDGEGLRIVLEPSGSARPIPFGESRASVVEQVSRLRNGQQPEMAENLDCRATVATWAASTLQLFFTPDAAPQFIGWSLGGRARTDSTAPAVTTASGIGIGSTRAALESAYVARVARSSLGVEFTAGGMAGLLASNAANAPIRNLWAGQVCLAR